MEKISTTGNNYYEKNEWYVLNPEYQETVKDFQKKYPVAAMQNLIDDTCFPPMWIKSWAELKNVL